MTLHRAQSTYNPGISCHRKSKLCSEGKTLSNVVALKAPGSGKVSNNPNFSISKWISVFWAAASWKGEGWLLHTALLLSLLTSFKCRTCSCHGFFPSLIPKKETGASDQDGEAERKKHSYNKGNPVKSHFKRNSTLGYTYTAFAAVWAERTVFTVWVLGTWLLLRHRNQWD